ncbi:MAG: DUF4833 domain-containing protein [Bdellovibrionaceae bacterium]|nr:DUF4833 domain-containing protein [Bdellovibrionales bacterium]MCB9255073.1 DUF4833 domain-containing protein [Pseudobdellovibrionaceae bacterium]
MIRPFNERWLLWILLLGPGAFAVEPLFTIDRSLNRNQVVYEVNLAEGGWDAGDPIRVYWVLQEEDGKIEALSAIEESFAYGVSVRKRDSVEVRFVLKALPKKEITVRRREAGKFVAVTDILGQPAVIKSIFIKTVGSGIFSSVRYVEVTGSSVGGEETLIERFEPKKSFG